MIRKIVTGENPTLRKKSKTVSKVDKKVLKLVKDLKDTVLAQKNPEGVGLAASQIGKNLNVFVIRNGKKLKTIINPKIVKKSKKKTLNTKKKGDILEGCLSIPHYYGPLSRSKEVTLEYTNEKNKKVTEKFEGFAAQVVQHEMDHLSGILFTDRLLKQKRPLYKQVGDDEWEEVDFA